jgi:hypothetical protein
MLTGALAMALGATPGSAATSNGCRVQNTDTGRSYAALQAAVDAAKRHDPLTVKGTCHGGTFIDRSLVIQGIRAGRSSKPVLDGEGKSRVLVIKPGVKVRMRNLTIRNGVAKHTQSSGGISNRGDLTLRGVIVRKNRHGSLHNEGVLLILGRSSVKDNTGGLFNAGRLVLTGRAQVRGNWATLENEGTLVMAESASIHHNNGHGVVNTGTVEMSGSSSIYGQNGRGIHSRGTVTLTDFASIHDNGGGGAHNEGTMVLSGSASIHDNRWAPYGGGVVNWGTAATLTLNGASSIRANAASGHGGGVWSAYGTVTLNDSSAIRDNVSGGDGGGIWNDAFRRVALTMTGSSTITGNSATKGGGVFNVGPRSLATLVGVSCAPQTLANVYGNAPDDCFFE